MEKEDYVPISEQFTSPRHHDDDCVGKQSVENWKKKAFSLV
jgi:hypothetical protein